MNAVEIEEAVSTLAERPFDAAEFPFAFLEAFGNKATTIKRLRTGASNRSDVTGPWGGVLQTNNIHITVAAPGAVTETLGRLKASPATAKAKAKFVLATDGDTFEAEDLESGETVACDYAAFPDHFGFSCRWRGSPPFGSCARAASTSAPRAASTGSIGRCWRRTRTGTPPSAGPI